MSSERSLRLKHHYGHIVLNIKLFYYSHYSFYVAIVFHFFLSVGTLIWDLEQEIACTFV